MEFSTGGADYWPASMVAVRKASTKWIRRDRDYLIRNNFLVEDIPACVPGPSILLSGDVERNPGPSPPHEEATIHVGTIMNMTNFKTKSLKNREKKARMEAPELHPCILPEDEEEQDKFMEEFCILDDSGDC